MADQRELEIVVNAKDEASKKMQSMGDKIGGIFSKVGVAVAASGAAIGAFAVSSINKFSEVGDAVEKMATRTGLSAESVSALRVAADGAGTSIETVEAAVKKMTLNVAEGADKGSAFRKAIEGFGYSFDQFKKSKPEEQFEALAISIGSIKDPAERSKAAMDTFGKAGTDLIPLFESGEFSMEAWSEQAKKLGVSFDDISAKSAADLNDAIGAMGIAFDGLALQVGGALAPAITELLTKFVEILPRIQDLAGLIQGSLTSAFGAVSGKVGEFIGWLEQTGVLSVFKDLLMQLWNAISIYLWPAIVQLWDALQPIMPILQAIAVVIGTVLLASFAALIAALALVIQWVGMFISKISSAVKTVLDFFKPALDKVTETFNGMGEIITSITSKIASFVDGVRKAVEAIASLISQKNKLDSKDTKASLAGQRASGGTVLGGSSYLVGEKGPEIFTPSSSGFITPNGGGGVGGVNVTINVGAVNNSIDMRRMADMVGEVIMGRVAANERI